MSLNLYPLGVVGAAVCAAIIAACAVPAHAKSRSFSTPKPSPVRVAPHPLTPPVKPPAPRVINKITNNTTVIRETRVVQAAPQRQSSGMFGNLAASMGGAMAGSMLGNWLSRPEPVQPQLAAPVEHAQPTCDPTMYNCEKKVP